jgi:hypothetical protein
LVDACANLPANRRRRRCDLDLRPGSCSPEPAKTRISPGLTATRLARPRGAPCRPGVISTAVARSTSTSRTDLVPLVRIGIDRRERPGPAVVGAAKQASESVLFAERKLLLRPLLVQRRHACLHLMHLGDERGQVEVGLLAVGPPTPRCCAGWVKSTLTRRRVVGLGRWPRRSTGGEQSDRPAADRCHLVAQPRARHVVV